MGDNPVRFGPNETRTLQIATGVQEGNCNIPVGTTAITGTMTIINPTEQSWLTIFPANEATPPSASNINWVALQATTANQFVVRCPRMAR